MEAILKSVASGVLAYTSHYGITKLYNRVCIPDGFWGYFSGMISTGSPICKAGIDIISNTQVSYSSLITMSIARIIIDILAPGVAKVA